MFLLLNSFLSSKSKHLNINLYQNSQLANIELSNTLMDSIYHTLIHCNYTCSLHALITSSNQIDSLWYTAHASSHLSHLLSCKSLIYHFYNYLHEVLLQYECIMPVQNKSIWLIINSKNPFTIYLFFIISLPEYLIK
jgi:hypothetical protein